MCAYPWWRLKQQSLLFTESLFDKALPLGAWSYGSVSFALPNKIRIAGAEFVPAGYSQGFSVGRVEMEVDIWDLLLSSEMTILRTLPSNLTITASNVQLNNRDNDLHQAMINTGHWPLLVGYLGGFGCGEIADHVFSEQQWREIMGSGNPMYDVELTYHNTGNYGLDFSLGINADNLWYANWSGTLELTDNSNNFAIQDAIVNKVYYSYADNGFNQKRNEYCQKNHQDSFMAYGAHSAERLQQQLRVLVGKEMPENISHWYQRSLHAGTEVNVIFDFENKQYLQTLYGSSQSDFLNLASTEVAIDESEYLPLELKKINYLVMDPDLLKDQYEKKEEKERERLANLNKPKEVIKTVRTTIGKDSRNNLVSIKNWGEAVGEKVMVKTSRGKPIFGKLISIKGNEIIMSRKYLTGTAEISIKKNNVLSLNRVN